MSADLSQFLLSCAAANMFATEKISNQLVGVLVSKGILTSNEAASILSTIAADIRKEIVGAPFEGKGPDALIAALKKNAEFYLEGSNDGE
ncbi:hypothetical protein AB1J06_01990 [Agrobacterium tumefaciens]